LITGIIMAAGFSRRMNRDKLTLEVGGVTVVERVIRAVKGSKVEDMVIVYRTNRIRELGEKYGIKPLYNQKAELGQSESIKLGINNSSKETTGFMFFVGDQPFLNSDIINRLIEVFQAGHYPIIVPEYRGQRGNPVIFSSSLKNELLGLEGDSGGRSIIKKRYNDIKTVPIDNDILGKDMDTWEEYQCLMTLL